MKRVLSMIGICIVLISLSGISVLAKGGTPDVTPPVVYAVGASPTTTPMKDCPGNRSVMVQGKAMDMGGVARVIATLHSPAGVMTNWRMSLMPDGYWRVWIPRTRFTMKGTWYVRVQAYDYFDNTTKSGWYGIAVSECDVNPPVLSEPTWSPNEIVGRACGGVRTALVQTTAWDASGIRVVELWFLAPGEAQWVTLNMARYSNNGYQAGIGNFRVGQAEFYIKAFDQLNHVSYTEHYFITVRGCPP